MASHTRNVCAKQLVLATYLLVLLFTVNYTSTIAVY